MTSSLASLFREPHPNPRAVAWWSLRRRFSYGPCSRGSHEQLARSHRNNARNRGQREQSPARFGLDFQLGRALRAVFEVLVAAKALVSVWADPDLDGVRIARLVHSWAPEEFQPLRIAPEDLVDAKPVRRRW